LKVNGVDMFHPNTGEVRSHGADGIACWFVDTDYNEELLRPPRLFPGRERSVQSEDHPESRDRRGSLGHAEQQHLAPF
jgi:hypothetical protein